MVSPLLDSAPVCLTCCAPVQGGHHCPACGWPLCGVQCRHSSAHSVECGVFSRAGVRLRVGNTDAEGRMVRSSVSSLVGK